MDGVGNRTSVVDDGKVTTYTTNSLNEYVYGNNQRLLYDLNGNMTSDRNLQMFYDHNNMLVEIRTRQYVFHQRFDAIGRRLMVQFSDGLTETRYFWYDGQQVIYEEVSGLTEPYKYVWGNGIDEALLRFGNGDIWYLDNQLGSVMGLTDSTGQIVERYSYDVYGAVTAYDAAGQQISMTNYDNRYLFTGREYNWHTGLYHYRARTYHPVLGRFLSRDLRSCTPGYKYGALNPARVIDPSGLQGQEKEVLKEEDLKRLLEKWKVLEPVSILSVARGFGALVNTRLRMYSIPPHVITESTPHRLKGEAALVTIGQKRVDWASWKVRCLFADAQAGTIFSAERTLGFSAGAGLFSVGAIWDFGGYVAAHFEVGAFLAFGVKVGPGKGGLRLPCFGITVEIRWQKIVRGVMGAVKRVWNAVKVWWEQSFKVKERAKEERPPVGPYVYERPTAVALERVLTATYDPIAGPPVDIYGMPIQQ